jgi:hypothetical protein
LVAGRQVYNLDAPAARNATADAPSNLFMCGAFISLEVFFRRVRQG